MKKIVVVVLVALSSIAVNAQTKTGYISTDEVFANIPPVKLADSLTMLENNRLAGLYKDRQDELNDLIALFVKDSVTMTTEAKEAKRKSLQGKLADLQASEQDFKNQLEQYKEKLYDPIRQKIFAAIRDIAKAKGFGTVLYRESAVLIPTGTDITKDVIKKMGGK